MKYSVRPKAWLAAGIIMAVSAAVTAPPAAAHHSFAMYDLSSTKTFTGKLTRFVPGANHAQVFFHLIDSNGKVITGEDGKPVQWGAETGPAARIAQSGITVDNFPEGTIISISINPLKDGRNFGNLARGEPIIKCGTELPKDGCTKETGEVFTMGGPGGP